MGIGQKKMKSFLILLNNHEQSKILGKAALDSAELFNWDLEIFDAIDGRKHSLQEYGLFHTTLKRKARDAFLRPGVVGCFLSHYLIWKKCLDLNETIGIFEQDIVFQNPNNNQIQFSEVLRLDKPEKTGKNYGTGVWWEGSHAYFVTPLGAKKLISWAQTHGAFPSDVMLGTDVVDIQFNLDNCISLNKDNKKYSLTVPENF